MEIVFLLAAELDLSEAFARYGERLHVKFEAALRHLQSQPELGAVFRGRFRRKLVIRSPFAIYYTIEGDRLMVYGVIDQRQAPARIIRRLAGGS